MPYREDARWGRLLSVHRASIGGWVLAMPIGILGVAMCAWHATTGERHTTKSAIGVVVMGMVTLWTLAEIVKLWRISLRVHERGIQFSDGRHQHEVEWTEISALEAQYVPGVLGRGAADRGNMVAVRVTTLRGSFTLPKELASFDSVVDTIRKKSGARWYDAAIGSLMSRS